MNFDNVKINDTVYSEEIVRINLNKEKRFFTPKKIIRVTKTQYTTDDNRRFYKNGGEIGGSCFFGCYNLGDEPFAFGNIVKDQSNELFIFKKKIKLEKSIDNIIRSLTINLDSKLHVIELIEIKERLESVEKLLNNKK